MQNKKSPIIVALDFYNLKEALVFIDKIDYKKYYLKVGSIMFSLFGPSLIKKLHRRGFEVFLDLKYHDIPSTVENAVSAAADLGVWMVNVHASGGIRMMHAARKALIKFGKNAPLLIAVTLLTSLEQQDLKRLGITDLTPCQYSKLLAYLAYESELDGVVCSAQKATFFKKNMGQNFLIVSPGIRPKDSINQDHRCIFTPQQAKQSGVDYIVIGRPITQSLNPYDTLEHIHCSLIGN